MKIKREEKEESASNKLIIIYIFCLVVFTEAIWTLISIFTKGYLKKEILSKKSGLGFDFDIIVK